MTAPVMQQTSQEIAMTAPVSTQQVDGAWQVRFVMPAAFSMQTLPSPNDDRVSLIEVPEKTYAVIQFSGMAGAESIDRHQAALMAYIKQEGLRVKAAPVYAFYNPPWTAPFMRRNEVMVELKEK